MLGISTLGKNLDPTLCECDGMKILYFLDHHYIRGNLVYPSAVARSTKTHIGAVYGVLDACLEAGIVTKLYDVYCPNCHRSSENIGYNIDAEHSVLCLHCDYEISNPSDYTYAIYRIC